MLAAGLAVTALTVQSAQSEPRAVPMPAKAPPAPEAAATGDTGRPMPPGIADGACYPGIVARQGFGVFEEALRAARGTAATASKNDQESGDGILGRMYVSDRYCLLQVLEYAPPDLAVAWRNPDLGVRYMVRAEPPQRDDLGRLCRRYALVMATNEASETRRLSGCRSSDGRWLLLR